MSTCRGSPAVSHIQGIMVADARFGPCGLDFLCICPWHKTNMKSTVIFLLFFLLECIFKTMYVLENIFLYFSRFFVILYHFNTKILKINFKKLIKKYYIFK